MDYLGRERASGVYKIIQLLPPEGEAFQYRIKNVKEPHERVRIRHPEPNEVPGCESSDRAVGWVKVLKSQCASRWYEALQFSLGSLMFQMRGVI